MTQNNWQSLISHPIRPDRSVLSVYLNVDQARQVNLNRGFEKRFKAAMASLRNTIDGPLELERFRLAEHHLSDFLRAYESAARTLVMLFDQSDGFFWHENVDISMNDVVRWDREFLLKPLAAATEDFERYGVALVDRAHARLFSVFLGEIEEGACEGFDPMKVRHIRTVGTDHWGSASQVQRKADEQVRRNLRRVVRDLDTLVKSTRVHRLLLAGTPELTAQFKELLPKRLAVLVIGTLDLDIGTTAKDVLVATLPLTQQYERETEEQIVNELATSAAKAHRAVVGLGNTLKKINEARVWQLIYSEDFHSPGFECAKCGALFSIERPACFYCAAALVPVDDVVEKAIERALRNDGKIEIVRGEAAASLDNSGGIGAFLKARTKSVEV